jgi:hypothetical protein
MEFLTRIVPRRQFRLPEFDLAPLAFEMSQASDDELLLDRIVTRTENEPKIVALAPPVPTAGELRASIERHLRATGRPPAPQPADAVDELRNALADLRRSLA